MDETYMEGLQQKVLNIDKVIKIKNLKPLEREIFFEDEKCMQCSNFQHIETIEEG